MAGKRKRAAAKAAPSREELLVGVLHQIRHEAEKRVAATQPPERGFWEWVVKVAGAVV